MKSTYKEVEEDLAQFAIETHGGLDRWKRFTTLSADPIQGGVHWCAKGNKWRPGGPCELMVPPCANNIRSMSSQSI